MQLEEFDPHEPYYVPDRFMSLYEKEYHGRFFDWPQYVRVGHSGETEEEIQHVINKYRAVVSMCRPLPGPGAGAGWTSMTSGRTPC